MSHETLEARSALKTLVDTFSTLADQGRIADQILLLTPDANVQVYMGDDLVFDLVGARQVEEAFAAFAATMRRSFHLNGQHVVELDGDAATGITYCQVKHVSDADGHEVITDSSVRYDDTYVRRDGRWFISRRIARFTMHETRALHPAS